MDYKKLKFENEYGTFNDDRNEYWVNQTKEKRIPIAWSNILTNENFGTVITDSLGGFVWYKNSQMNKITQFKNDAYLDESSEKIILKIDNNIFSIDVKNKPDDQNYYTCFGIGYTTFYHTSNQVEQKMDVFVPINYNAKIYVLNLKNISKESKQITISYKASLQLAQTQNKSMLYKNYRENLNMNIIRNTINQESMCYITSNIKMSKNQELKISLNPNEEKNVIIVLGCEENENDIIDKSIYILNNYEKIYEETKTYWKDLTSNITSKTPSIEFDTMQNSFLAYQSIASRLYARTGYYQVGGAYGFRDQLQDAIGMKWVNPEILKKQILICAEHQFKEGDVEHWFHQNTGLGIRSFYSDDPLWLVYAVEEYINFTGDYSILDEKRKFLIAPINDKTNDENIFEIVNYFPKTETAQSLLKHILKAVNFSSHLGKHNLPLILHGDWNDAMSNLGNFKKGESIWLGFFLYLVLQNLIKILKEYSNSIQNKKIISKYNKICDHLKIALNTKGWNGKWYIRSIDKNGNIVGTKNNSECKIDSISQSFSVISKAGDNDKKYIAMKSFEDNLIDETNNLVKLLNPPIEKNNMGYISSYAPGMRENGGQYLHSVIWAMIAEAMLNKNEEVAKIYKTINPIYRTQSKLDIEKYKVEPYVIPADIYTEGNLLGRGGWTWYTGSSAWLYEAQIKYILGINIYHNQLQIKPCVPKDWNKYQVKLHWYDAIYTLNFIRTGAITIENLQEPYELKTTGEYTLSITF